MPFNIEDYAGPIGPYSQFCEDRILLALVERLKPMHSFLEFGAGNGEQNCTRILAEELGWTGVWLDGDDDNIKVAKPIADRLGIRCSGYWLTLDRIGYVRSLVPKNIGVLSLDVDGNDYHFWKALCDDRLGDGVRPAICIIEANTSYKAHDVHWVMPYNPDFVWDHASGEFGASVRAMTDLGTELGYRFVGRTPDYHSPNLFFVREDYAERL